MSSQNLPTLLETTTTNQNQQQQNPPLSPSWQQVPPEPQCKQISRGAKFSPCGGYLLTNNDDNILRLYSPQPEDEFLEPYAETQKGECVFDFVWNPTMNPNDKDSCCFLTSSFSFIILL